MPLRIIALLATMLLATNVLAVGNQYINPVDGKCNVQLPPTSSVRFWSDSGNKIKYTLRADAGWLMATCLMTDIITGGDLPDSAVPYTADDFTSNVPVCRFRDKSIPLTVDTEDFHITVTPAGKIKLVCFFEWDNN